MTAFTHKEICMQDLSIVPFSSGCGALIDNLQLATCTDTEVDLLRQASSEFGVLFFRNQVLPPHEHLRFGRRFGNVVVNKFFQHLTEYPEIAEVRKEKQQETNIGGGWHTDHSYDDIPAMGSILVARQVPSRGGATHFANLYAAYDDLSDGLKKVLHSLTAIHSNDHLYGESGYYAKTDLANQLQGQDSVSEATHPVVIVHPRSGRKALYVNPAHTIGITGWSQEESRALLNYLYEHAAQSKYICQFNWETDYVALWDNRCTWHFAQNDYHGEARLMHRLTIEGTRLVGV